MAKGIRLHIGGEEVRPGWRIFNVRPGPDVDYVGHCTDLSALEDRSCREVYASHVFEHLGYNGELQQALKEINRVLEPGGALRISVPDLEVLCRLLLHPTLSGKQRFHVMRMMFGGRTNPYDVHYVGLTFEFMGEFLHEASFCNVRRVTEFGIFNDASSLQFSGQLISLNVEAEKPAA